MELNYTKKNLRFLFSFFIFVTFLTFLTFLKFLFERFFTSMADNGPVGRCGCFLDSVLTVFSATSQLYSLDLYSPRLMKQTNINIVSNVILQVGLHKSLFLLVTTYGDPLCSISKQ